MVMMNSVLFLLGFNCFCQDQPVGTSQVTVWPPPSTGKSDHRAESASGGGGETVDGVSAYGGLSNQPGRECYTGTPHLCFQY